MSKPIAAPIHVGPDSPCWTETLADGTRMTIRPVCKLDAETERAFIERLSPKALHNRFLGLVAHPSDDFIEQLTDIDYTNDVALAAVIRDGNLEKFIGVSRYAVDRERNRCECAVVVADDWQNRGVGTELMRRLIEIARQRGLGLMESIDLGDNMEMRQLARDLGFQCRSDPEDARQVIYSLRLDEPPVAA